MPISGQGQPRSPKLLLCFPYLLRTKSLKCFCSFMNISISSWLALFSSPSLAPTCSKFTDVPSFVPLNGNRIHSLNVHHRSLSSVNNNYFHYKRNKCGLALDNLSFFFPCPNLINPLSALGHYRNYFMAVLHKDWELPNSRI